MVLHKKKKKHIKMERRKKIHTGKSCVVKEARRLLFV
jgi:hypothetical protein